MGGDGDLVPAAARPARRGTRPHHASRSRRCCATSSRRDGVGERFLAFLRDLRAETHRRDIAAAEDPALARELERSAGLYAAAAERFEARGRRPGRARSRRTRPGRRRRPTRCCRCWPRPRACACSSRRGSPPTGAASGPGTAACGCPSAATRRGSTRSSRRRACTPRASTSPTCSATAPRPSCARCAPAPGRCSSRSTGRSWTSSGTRAGYPSHGAYRDTRRYTEHRHTPWAVDGAPYDPARAAAQVRADAEHFVSEVARRIERGGLCVCALDTELLGHFWHEGVDWLAAVDRGLRRRRGRAGRARRGARRAARCGAGAGRPAADELGRAARPRDLERAGRGGAPVARAQRRAAGPRRDRPPRRRAAAPCASCSRCRPPTGPSGSAARRPARTRASGPRGTPPSSSERSRIRRDEPFEPQPCTMARPL